MKDCILFLNGTYRSSELAHYQALASGKFSVAVDGGFSFFRRTKSFPDLLIGDFDSIRQMPRKLPATTQVRQYPTQKDKTDAELALEYCLDAGARNIDIIQPSYGEPDQLLGNFLLLSLVTRKKKRRQVPNVRIVNRLYEVILLQDSSFVVRDGIGNTVSIIPLSEIITLTASGVAYSVRAARISRGRSLGMRNQIVKPRAAFTIAGTALLVHQFRPGSRGTVAGEGMKKVLTRST